MESLLRIYAPAVEVRGELSVYRFVEDIESGNAECLMRRFESFFASLDYQLQGDLEIYFQNTMLIMLTMLGEQVQVERHTSNGRIDVVIQTPEYVYVMELKRDQSPELALQQIAQKGYDRPFLSGGRKIFRIGVNFSSETRRIEGWLIA